MHSRCFINRVITSVLLLISCACPAIGGGCSSHYVLDKNIPFSYGSAGLTALSGSASQFGPERFGFAHRPELTAEGLTALSLPKGSSQKTWAGPGVTLQEPTGDITLSDALALAIIGNSQLTAFSIEERIREAGILQAGLLPNPEVTLVQENFGNSKLEEFDGTATTLQLGQLIELGGKRSRRQQLASLERDLARWDYETKRLDVYLDVTKAFVNVLSIQERLTLTAESIKLLEDFYQIVSERVKAGKSSQIEEIKAGVTLDTKRLELERTKRELETARKRLAATWGSTSATFEKTVGDFQVTSAVPSLEKLAELISRNPDIARWTTEMAQRRADLKLQESQRIPDLIISGGVRQFNEADNERAFVLGLGLPLPIFNRNQGAILEARHRLSKAEQEQKSAELLIATELSSAYQELATAFSELVVIKESILPQSQKAFESVLDGYRQGKFSQLEVLDTQRTLFEVKTQYLETLSLYHQSRAEAERLIGSPVPPSAGQVK